MPCTTPTNTSATLARAEPEAPPRPVDPAPLRVVIADDHPLFRQGIARALERHPDIVLVGEADNGIDALELIDVLDPDVAVLDHRMPGLTGVDVCTVLQTRGGPPKTATLLLSAFEDSALVWSAVCSGAAGYIGKTASQQEICEAVLKLGRGEVAFTALAADAAAEGFVRHLEELPPT